MRTVDELYSSFCKWGHQVGVAACEDYDLSRGGREIDGVISRPPDATPQRGHAILRSCGPSDTMCRTGIAKHPTRCSSSNNVIVTVVAPGAIYILKLPKPCPLLISNTHNQQRTTINNAY